MNWLSLSRPKTLTVILNKKLRDLEEMRNIGGPVGDVKVYKDDYAAQLCNMKRCKGLITKPRAASLYPYRLVCHMIRRCLEKPNFKLYTETPVISISKDYLADKWIVKTPRTTISASKVVHTTNAYASGLLDDLKGVIVPIRGQIQAITAPEGSLPGPMSFRGSMEYLLQRKSYGHEYILGGGRDHATGGNLEIGIIDDSTCDPGASKYLSHFITNLKNEGDLKLIKEWTGIMGFTADQCPLVGEFPSKPGCYIAAGFSGHGMPRVFLSSKAVAETITKGALPDWLPRAYRITTDRLAFLQSQEVRI